MLWELDEFKPPTMLGFIRSLPDPVEFVGQNWLPNRTIDDLSFEYLIGANRQRVMAHVMGFDAQAPLHGRGGQSAKIGGELPPIKRKARIGEKEIIRFLQPRAGSNDVMSAVTSVYATAAELVDAIQARVEWLRMQALSEDKIVYDEGGVIFQFDFGLNDEFQIDLVAGTNGEGTNIAADVGPAWTDPAATPLKTLQYISDLVQRKTGARLKEMVLSGKSYGLLLNNQSIRDLIRGPSAPQAVLTPGELDTALALYNLPSLRQVDTFVTRENEDGTLTEIRTMAENKSFLTTGGPVGQTLYGPTAESRVLFGTKLSSAAPGVWAETYGTTEPPAEWVKAAAVAFPTMPDSNRLAQITLHA